jgi:hypothetical protein
MTTGLPRLHRSLPIAVLALIVADCGSSRAAQYATRPTSDSNSTGDSHGTLRDSFRQWQVHVYRIKLAATQRR